MKFLAALIFLLACIEAKDQRVQIMGTTWCHKEKMGNVTVEIWDRNFLMLDDLVASTSTRADGKFDFRGNVDDTFEMKPYLRFLHTCRVEKPGCIRTTEYEIPAEFINSKEKYNMEIISLDIFSTEDFVTCE